MDGHSTTTCSNQQLESATDHFGANHRHRVADLVGGASEAAFTWDQLIDGALNSQLRVKRTISVEDGHIIVQPAEVQDPEGGLQDSGDRCGANEAGEAPDGDQAALAAANGRVEAELGTPQAAEPAGGARQAGHGASTADDGASDESESSLGSISSSNAALSYVQVRAFAS